MNILGTSKRIGLTGGIGSGKSTVASMLSDLGIPLVDADAISRGVTAAGGVAMADIASEFGPEYVDNTGALDRERMRALVFADASAKKRLEAIIHPLVGQAIDAAIRNAESAGARSVVIDIPLLVESGHWRRRLDRVLVIDCQETTQVQRVSERNGLDVDQIQRIMAGQATRTQRMAAADAVIFNDGIDLHTLRDVTRQMALQFGL